MRIAIFCHSLWSCWNHGNAHFLRGIVRDLQRRGHAVRVLEPENGWSRENLLREDAGDTALSDVQGAFPDLSSTGYEPDTLDVDAVLDGVDLALVHEWTDPAVVAAVARHKRQGGRYTLLFHDTHHRAVTRPEELGAFDLDGFDGVLAFGNALSRVYETRGWGRRVWTWHEAADVTRFRPLPEVELERDLVWVGNWGDDERTAELHEFLLEPARRIGLNGLIHGVRYPESAIRALHESGLTYGGWIANHRVPEVFARHRMTVHVPRRPYVEALPGIPTIRVFEALACGIPLVSAPWPDSEGLFRPGTDFLVANNGQDMERHLRDLLADPALRAALAEQGLATILARHTCTHRVDQLLDICASLHGTAAPAALQGVA